MLSRSFLSTRLLSTTPPRWSGHNKWSKIKARKGMEDAKKSAVYGKASRDIIVAVRNGGSANPELNNMLATALRKARTSGVPKDTIEAALARATRGKEAGDHHLVFEALAAKGSVGMIIECLSNNQNRTLHNIRDILTRNGAHVASVGFLFERKGSVRMSLPASDDILEKVLASSAEDFDEVGRSDGAVEMIFTCPPNELAPLTSQLSSLGDGCEVLASELVYMPKDPAETLDGEAQSRIAELKEALEEDPDCLRVWTTVRT